MTNPAAQMQTLVQQYQAILQKEQAAEQAQVEAYRRQLAELSQQYAQAAATPPKPVTIPAIFGRSHRENFISDYLAYILNPAKNGLGPGPLVQLLHLCDIDPGEVPLAEVVIHREYTVGSGRIDLLLEWEDALVLGIENKIYAAEGDGQTRYYAHEIPKLFKDTPCHFAFLTRGGRSAQSKKFKPISYAGLLEALRQVRVSPNTGARQLILWHDFLEHLEVYIIMSDPGQFEFSDKAKLYLEHHAMIQDLETTFKDEWGAAITYIEDRVRANLDDDWETQFNPQLSRGWHVISKSAWRQEELWVHFEYWFAPYWLARREFTFVLDVEGKQNNDFLDRFDQRYPALEPTYKRREMIYRPSNRKVAIAHKIYPISQDIDEIAQVFIDAFEEFRFLEAEVDAVLAEMNRE